MGELADGPAAVTTNPGRPGGWSSPDNGSIGSVPQTAPAAIQSRSTDFSASGSGALGGISSDSTRSQTRLSSGLPATIACPCLPPRNAVAFVDRSSFPLGSGPEWQSRHRRARMGATVESKTRTCARGLSAVAFATHSEISKQVRATVIEFFMKRGRNRG